MILSIISAIGKNNEIGKGNSLLWNLPVDMKHFKETTTGHPIIMGQKTFESIGKPLPNRRNIVLTLDKDFKRDDIEIYYSIDDLVKNISETTKKNEEIFIIGGGQIYKLFIEFADKLYITHVDEYFRDADTFFPIIDKEKWQKIESQKYNKDSSNIYNLEFAIYSKK
jgi:dihydrofolate reductase